MRNGQLRYDGKLQPSTHKPPMLVTDIVRYLSGLAKLHDSKKTGNPALSQGLRQLGNALRPYGNCTMLELGDVIKMKAGSANTPQATSSKAKMALPPNLESLTQEDVEKILADDSYTKQQVAELGFQRFGISKSMLSRLRKEDAKRSVQSALDNERTLDVISEMARKAGKARAS